MIAETLDVLDAFDRATLLTALEALAAGADRAVVAGRVASEQAPRVTEQLAKALRVIEITPVDLTTLLVHLTVARTLVTEGWGPPTLAHGLSTAIARVHHLARTAPEVFR